MRIMMKKRKSKIESRIEKGSEIQTHIHIYYMPVCSTSENTLKKKTTATPSHGDSMLNLIDLAFGRSEPLHLLFFRTL